MIVPEKVMRRLKQHEKPRVVFGVPDIYLRTPCGLFDSSVVMRDC